MLPSYKSLALAGIGAALLAACGLQHPTARPDAQAPVVDVTMDTADVTDAPPPDRAPDVDVPPACGGANEMCCATGPQCGAGLVCTNNRCAPPCGGAGEACCTATPGCRMGLTCMGSRCVDLRCPVAGQEMCNGVCVNVQESVEHCGRCANACPTMGANVTGGVCTAGMCRLACATGFADCDGMAANGCEVNTATDGANCGGCGMSCVAMVGMRMNVTPACTTGTCRFNCNAGFENCDGNNDNGCETNTNTSARNCGRCATVCMDVPGGVGACATGTCGFTCNPGFTRMGAACLGVNPRPVGPLSGSLVQPTRMGADLAVRIQLDLMAGMAASVQFCADRACTMSLGETGTITTGNMVVALPSGALGRSVVYWRTRGRYPDGTESTAAYSTTVWQMFLTAPVTTGAMGPGGVWGNVPDVNGDGVADIIVGDTGSNRAFLYFRAPTTTSSATAADQILNAPMGAPSGFGAEVSPAGDVNGDGVADLLVATPQGSGARVYVFHGRTGATLATAPATTLTTSGMNAYAMGAAGLGDVTGDGYGDVGVLTNGALLVYPGSATGVQAASPRMIAEAAITMTMGGATLAPAGDVNGDGLADVVVGMPGAMQARVYYGSTGAMTASTQLTGNATFGRGVSGAGDFTGDGFLDVAVGQPDTNQVRVYPGSMAGVGTSSVTLTGLAGTGFSISAGDFNRDGRGDVLTGNEASNVVGHFLGSATPTFTPITNAFRDFGYTVSLLNDVNGDGFSDAMVGCNQCNGVWVYYGSMAGLSATISSFVQPPTGDLAPASRFGSAIACLRPTRRSPPRRATF